MESGRAIQPTLKPECAPPSTQLGELWHGHRSAQSTKRPESTGKRPQPSATKTCRMVESPTSRIFLGSRLDSHGARLRLEMCRDACSYEAWACWMRPWWKQEYLPHSNGQLRLEYNGT